MFITTRLTTLVALALSLASCSVEKPEKKNIRGHYLDYDGVAHAVPATKALRYCVQCHGSNLEGGTDGEPSCLRCHGENWLKYDASTSAAPSSHTVGKTGSLYTYMHHYNLKEADDDEEEYEEEDDSRSGSFSLLRKRSRTSKNKTKLSGDDDCNSCHGAGLLGNVELGRPSCYLCHGKKW